MVDLNILSVRFNILSDFVTFKPSSCLSNREENEIYSYAQNDLVNRMARCVIDSKSTVNLNGMQHHGYPGARTNFFYDFSATGNKIHYL